MEYDALTKAITQWAVEMRALQLTSAHRKPAVELEEVGIESDLGHVPLHGALGVNRGANAPLLLLTGQRDSMHTGEMQQIAGLRAHAHR